MHIHGFNTLAEERKMRAHRNSFVFAAAMAVMVFVSASASADVTADGFREDHQTLMRNFGMFMEDVRGHRDDPENTTAEDLELSRGTYELGLELQRSYIQASRDMESGTERDELASAILAELASDVSWQAEELFNEVNGVDRTPGFGDAAYESHEFLEERATPQLESLQHVCTDEETDFHVSGIALSSVILARDQLQTLEAEQRQIRNHARRAEERAYARVSVAIATASEYGYPYPQDAMDHFTSAAREHRHVRHTHRVIRAQANFFAELAAELEALPRIETPAGPETVEVMVEAEPAEESAATPADSGYLAEAMRMISRAYRVEIPAVIAVQPQVHQLIEAHIGGLAITGPIFGYTEDQNVSLLSLSEMRETFEEPERAAAGQESPPADTPPSAPPEPAEPQHEQPAPEETAPQLQIEPENIGPPAPGSEEPTEPSGELHRPNGQPSQTRAQADSPPWWLIGAFSGVTLGLILFLVILFVRAYKREADLATELAEQKEQVRLLEWCMETDRAKAEAILKAAGEELNRRLAASRKERDEVRESATRLTEIMLGENQFKTAQVQDLERQLDEIRNTDIGELFDQNDQLRQAIADLRHDKDGLNADKEELRETIRLLEAKLAGAQSEGSAWKSRAESAEQVVEQLTANLNDAHEALYDASRSRRGSRGRKSARRPYTEPDGLPAAVSFPSGDDFRAVPLPDATAEAEELGDPSGSPAPHLPVNNAPPYFYEDGEPITGSGADTTTEEPNIGSVADSDTADFAAVPFEKDGTSGNN